MQEYIGYMRVSSKNQNEDRQRKALIDIGVQERNIYLDKESGMDFDRKQYKRMLKRLNPETVLFVKSLDRLGRSYKDLNEQWRIITKEKGADIVIIDMPILDTRRDKDLLGTFISDFTLALFSYVAENERLCIKSRQAEGIAAARERGVKFGRPARITSESFYKACDLWVNKELSLPLAAQMADMPQSTFYDKARKFRQN